MKSKERSISFIIVSVLTLLLSLFVLYQTVFKQILNQEQGFFYAGVFGFILLLVFLLCNLLTKLIATGNKLQNSIGWRITALAILGLIALYFLLSKMKYYYSLSASEETFYLSATSLMDGIYSENEFLINESLKNPCLYVHSVFFSYIFKIISVVFPTITEFSRVTLWTNAIIYVLCIGLVYRITLKVTDRICALISALLSAIIPCQTFIVYSYAPESVFALLFLLVLDLDLYLFMHNTGKKAQNSTTTEVEEPDIKCMIITGILSLLTGLLLFAEPVMIIPCILIVVMAFVSKKDGFFNLFIALSAAIVLFAGFCLIKSVRMDVDFGQVLASEAKTFNFMFDNIDGDSKNFSGVYDDFSNSLAIQDNYLSDSFEFITESSEYSESAYTITSQSWLLIENELFYMFLLVMLVSCVIISIKEYLFYVIPLEVMFIGLVILQFFNQNRFTEKYPFIALLIILCGVSIDYLYLNHHPDQIVVVNALDALEKTTNSNIESINITNKDADNDVAFLKRAQALIFVGNDEDLYQQIKNEEHRNAIHGDGKAKALPNTFDDYDDDFFLDEADAEAKRQNTGLINTSTINAAVDNNQNITKTADISTENIAESTNATVEAHTDSASENTDNSVNTNNTDSKDNTGESTDSTIIISSNPALNVNNQPVPVITNNSINNVTPVINNSTNSITPTNDNIIPVSADYYNSTNNAYGNINDMPVNDAYNNNPYINNGANTQYNNIYPINYYGNNYNYTNNPVNNNYANAYTNTNYNYPNSTNYTEQTTYNTPAKSTSKPFIRNPFSAKAPEKEPLKLDMLGPKDVNETAANTQPEVTNTSKDKKKNKKKNKFSGKLANNITALDSGIAVRKVKNLSGNNNDAVVQEYMASHNIGTVNTDIVNDTNTVKEEPRFIPNPLPLPKKKPHVELDYDDFDDKSSGSGWDYDYEVADDDDWDV